MWWSSSPGKEPKLEQAQSSAQTVFENARNDGARELAELHGQAAAAGAELQRELDTLRPKQEAEQKQADSAVQQARAMLYSRAPSQSPNSSGGSCGTGRSRFELPLECADGAFSRLRASGQRERVRALGAVVPTARRCSPPG